MSQGNKLKEKENTANILIIAGHIAALNADSGTSTRHPTSEQNMNE